MDRRALGCRVSSPRKLCKSAQLSAWPPRCWALTPSHDAVEFRRSGSDACLPGWRQSRQAHPVPTPAPLSTFVPSVGQTMFAQRTVALFGGDVGNARVLGVSDRGNQPCPGRETPGIELNSESQRPCRCDSGRRLLRPRRGAGIRRDGCNTLHLLPGPLWAGRTAPPIAMTSNARQQPCSHGRPCPPASGPAPALPGDL